MFKWVAGLFLAGLLAVGATSHVQADKGFPLTEMRQASVRIETSIAIGSGVVVGPTMVLTAGHVCEGESKVDVIFDNGVRRQARVIVYNAPEDRDFCAVYVPVPDQYKPARVNCQPAQWGEAVAAVGNPLGEFQTISFGHVAGTEDYEAPFAHRVMLDITTTYGNSGGPIFNTSGEVIGLLVQTQLFIANPYTGPVWQTGFQFMTPSTNFCSSLPGDFK